MAIQWADDFSRYGTGNASRTAMLDGLPYSNVVASGGYWVQPDPDPLIIGGRAFEHGNGGTSWWTHFRVALPTVISGVARAALRFWPTELPTSAARRMSPIGWQNVSGDVLAMLVIEQNGAISVSGRVTGSLTEIANTVNPVLSPSAWTHLEMEYDRANGTGKVFVDGVERLSFSGVDTDTGNVALFHSVGAIGNTVSDGSFIKDLVIADGTGSVNNGVIGTVVVGRLKPNADIALGDWTPSTGSTGWDLLSKNAVDDTTYLSAADTPMPSADMRFELENLPPDITSIRALISVTRQRKIDGGDGNVQTALSPNGTDWDNGADRPITTSFQYDFDVSELSPATSSPWTPLEVDNAELRIDRTV